jgi:uncharacterized membrane protein HdeD (DUF308 family)
MVYFQTKHPNLGKFWKSLQWKIVSAILSILPPYVLFYGNLVTLVVIWEFLPVWVCCTEKNLATLLKSQLVVGQ